MGIELDVGAEVVACDVSLDRTVTGDVWVMTGTMLVGVGCTGVGGVINNITSSGWLL